METGSGDLLAELAAVLAEKNNIMTRVLFKAEAMHGVLVSQRTKWLTEARRELEDAWEEALAGEDAFQEALRAVAIELGLSPESTLREVASACGEPWGFIFSQNREEILALAQQIEQVSLLNRSMLARGALATSTAISILGGSDLRTYDHLGGDVGRSGSIHTVDIRS